LEGRNKMEKANRLFAFVGVTTKKSAINNFFPLWIKFLDADCTLVGIDIALDASLSQYDGFLEQFLSDQWIGALITTHKSKIFHKLDSNGYANLTDRAKLLEEASVIYKNANSEIFGDATDPDAILPILSRLLSDERWLSGCLQILIMGGGGAGLALFYTIVSSGIIVKKIVITESDPLRRQFLIKKVDEIVRKFKSEILTEITDSQNSDKTITELGSGALIVNATGMGKDLPGSPIRNPDNIFNNSIIWEFNYRGELKFLNDCVKIRDHKNLLIEDGWYYFIHGWANVLCTALNKTVTEKLLTDFETVTSK
jgi:shikimate dehydrogenase